MLSGMALFATLYGSRTLQASAYVIVTPFHHHDVARHHGADNYTILVSRARMYTCYQLGSKWMCRIQWTTPGRGGRLHKLCWHVARTGSSMLLGPAHDFHKAIYSLYRGRPGNAHRLDRDANKTRRQMPILSWPLGSLWRLRILRGLTLSSASDVGNRAECIDASAGVLGSLSMLSTAASAGSPHERPLAFLASYTLLQ
jgi:hypothetical protein